MATASHRQLQPPQQKLPPVYLYYLSWCENIAILCSSGRSHHDRTRTQRVARNLAHAQTVCTRPTFSPYVPGPARQESALASLAQLESLTCWSEESTQGGRLYKEREGGWAGLERPLLLGLAYIIVVLLPSLLIGHVTLRPLLKGN